VPVSGIERWLAEQIAGQGGGLRVCIGMRVQPQLLPFMGGETLGGLYGVVRRGRADEVASGQPCDYVAYEADVPGLGRFGVCLLVLQNTATPDRRGAVVHPRLRYGHVQRDDARTHPDIGRGDLDGRPARRRLRRGVERRAGLPVAHRARLTGAARASWYQLAGAGCTSALPSPRGRRRGG
jgi:hypothetical protein